MSWRPFSGNRPRRPIAAGWFLLAALGLPAIQARAAAADVEARDFAILVDNKQAGEYHMVIQRQDDGTTTLTAQSDVRVTILAVPVYTYSYRGQETWKDGRVVHFESSGKEGSKPFAISAAPQGDMLVVKANGQVHATRPDVWLTSCWQLPDARVRGQAVMLLGCDNGKDVHTALQYLGTDSVRVAGQQQTCAHYRVVNTVPHDLWYDGEERLVRQEWTSDGHRSVLELTQLRH